MLNNASIGLRSDYSSAFSSTSSFVHAAWSSCFFLMNISLGFINIRAGGSHHPHYCPTWSLSLCLWANPIGENDGDKLSTENNFPLSMVNKLSSHPLRGNLQAFGGIKAYNAGLARWMVNGQKGLKTEGSFFSTSFSAISRKFLSAFSFLE